MKKVILLLCLAFFVTFVNGQNSDSLSFDQVLADSLGADEHGMKVYSLVILKTGSNKTKNKTLIDSLFKGHMANIVRLANEKKLIVAGPLFKNKKSYRGIFILDTKSIDEANKMLMTDPAIKSKLLSSEIYLWYGSAALPVYLPVHKKIEKKGF